MTTPPGDAVSGPGRQAARADASVGEVAARSALAWLDTLSVEQQRLAVWPFGSTERGDWYYAPRRRNGLPLRDMDGDQRDAAYALLRSTLSSSGNDKARAIMALEEVLGALEDGQRADRDPLNYAFTVFGQPGEPPWGWRVEGHHLILNVTVADPEVVAVTPTFWGANPARIPRGPRAGERVLASEYHFGLELARSLVPAQRRQAVFGDGSVGNIITERGRAQALGAPTGLAASDLDDGQRTLVKSLIETYVGSFSDGAGLSHRAHVRQDGLNGLRFAWAGGMSEGDAFYYRMHGPRLLIEFDCTANDANHIHSIWRDPRDDWGRDILGEHYRRHHDND